VDQRVDQPADQPAYQPAYQPEGAAFRKGGWIIMPTYLTIGIFIATVALIAVEIISEGRGGLHKLTDRYHDE
jgi:hypothetical protein